MRYGRISVSSNGTVKYANNRWAILTLFFVTSSYFSFRVRCAAVAVAAFLSLSLSFLLGSCHEEGALLFKKHTQYIEEHILTSSCKCLNPCFRRRSKNLPRGRCPNKLRPFVRASFDATTLPLTCLYGRTKLHTSAPQRSGFLPQLSPMPEQWTRANLSPRLFFLSFRWFQGRQQRWPRTLQGHGDILGPFAKRQGRRDRPHKRTIED